MNCLTALLICLEKELKETYILRKLGKAGVTTYCHLLWEDVEVYQSG